MFVTHKLESETEFVLSPVETLQRNLSTPLSNCSLTTSKSVSLSFFWTEVHEMSTSGFTILIRWQTVYQVKPVPTVESQYTHQSR